MKKLFYSVFFFTLLVSTFQSCSSDDDNDSGNNGFNLDNEVIFDGTTYSLNDTGYLESYGINTDGSYDWDVELVSSDITIYLDLNTNSSDGLVEGTYTYSTTRQAFSYVYAEVIFEEDNIYYSWNEGEIEIDIDGDNVAIQFNGTYEVDGNETSIACEWSGTLTTIEED